MKFGKMKKMFIITLVVMVGVFTQGCSKGGNEEDVVNQQDEDYEDEDYEEEDQGEDYDEEDQEEDYEDNQEDQGDTQRVGNSEHGFITLPSDWVSLKELGESELETYYTNENRTATIMLFANRNPIGDPQETAQDSYQTLEEQGGVELEAAKGELIGYEVVQIFGQYEEPNRQALLWFFEVEEGCVHSIVMESTAGEIQELKELVESSFGLEE